MKKDKDDLNAVIARNLQRFLDEPGALYRNANALAEATNRKVSDSTIRNLLDPSKRTTASNKTEGFPKIDTLRTVLGPLKKEVWQLLHPDLDSLGELQSMDMERVRVALTMLKSYQGLPPGVQDIVDSALKVKPRKALPNLKSAK